MPGSEIKTRTLNAVDALWWKFLPGTLVTVKWPVGRVVLHEMSDGSLLSAESADPNDHYRPWLEENIGKQGWDWQWRISSIAADNGQGTVGVDSLTIKIRKKHEYLASAIALKWK